MTTNLDFLEKPGCHLCETALPLVRRLSRRLNLDVRRVDIDHDDALVAEFGLRIPVVRLGDKVIAEGIIEYRTLLASARRALASAAER